MRLVLDYIRRFQCISRPRGNAAGDLRESLLQESEGDQSRESKGDQSGRFVQTDQVYTAEQVNERIDKEKYRKFREIFAFPLTSWIDGSHFYVDLLILGRTSLYERSFPEVIQIQKVDIEAKNKHTEGGGNTREQVGSSVEAGNQTSNEPEEYFTLRNAQAQVQTG